MKQGGETVFVAVLILFSAAALWLAYGIAGFSKWSSPGVFPMLASATMLVCGLFIFRDNQKVGSTPVITEQPTIDASPTLPIRVVIISVLLALYVVAMPTLGFLLSSGLFLLTSISYLWKKPLWMALLVSAVSLAAIHVVFRLVFQVILPKGTLIGLLS